MAKGKYQRWLEPEGLVLLEGWARDGLTDEQIAHNMGCSYSTFRDWRDKFPTFSAALKKGKEVADYEVESALYRSAIGYDYEEITTEIDGNGKKHIKKVKKHQPGNPTAQIFWLKNRKPAQWKDRREEVVTAQVVDQNTIDEIEEFLNGIGSTEEAATGAAEE